MQFHLYGNKIAFAQEKEVGKVNTEEILELAVELGYQIQIAGGEIYRVEESVGRLLRAYGIETAEVFAIPNCLIASAHEGGRAVTSVRRIPNHGTNIWRLEAMNGLCRRLCAMPLPAADARRELEELLAGEKQYSAWTLLLAHFFGAGMFTLFFAGSWRDALCAGACGVATGLTLMGMDKLGATLLIKTVTAGGVSALLALGLCAAGLGQSIDLITIGALMLLVPGVALTNAVRDVMVGDMVSGLSKLAEAVLIGVAIALGTGLAMGLARLF